MPDVARLHHTGLTVTDLDRSIAFYRDLLGFEVVGEQERRGGYFGTIVGYPDAHARLAHLSVPGSDDRIELIQYISPAPRAGELEPRTVGATHVCLVVEDLTSLYERLVAAGVDSWFTPPVEIDSGMNTGGLALYFRDPDGIILELFQPAKR